MRDNYWNIDDESEGDFRDAMHHRTEELYSVPDAEPDADGLIECPVLPLRDLVVYPHMVSPVFVSTDQALYAIEEAQIEDTTVIAFTQRDPEKENAGSEDYLPIGVEMAVGRLLSMPDGSSSALVQARRRVEFVEYTQYEPFLVARVRPIHEAYKNDKQTEASMRTVREMFQRCVQMNRSLPEESYLFALNIEDPGWLADMISTAIAPPFEDRQALLQNLSPLSRLKKVIKLLAEELDVLELEDQIQSRAQSEVDRSQREFYLREQLKVIQTELSDGDPWTREIAELRVRVEGLSLPDEVLARALKEIDRLTQMPPMSPEVTILRTYVDWIVELPWMES